MMHLLRVEQRTTLCCGVADAIYCDAQLKRAASCCILFSYCAKESGGSVIVYSRRRKNRSIETPYSVFLVSEIHISDIYIYGKNGRGKG